MAKKKDKTKITQRRQKVKQQKGKKRKLRLVKGGGEGSPGPMVAERPGMPHLGAPEGFRSISFSQAIMEHGAPLMEYVKDENALALIENLKNSGVEFSFKQIEITEKPVKFYFERLKPSN